MAAASDGEVGTEDARAEAAERFVVGGLATLGIDADEAEMAVIRVADALYRPLIEKLLADELDGVAPEPGIDVSGPPRNVGA
jgi:hypothetical protein